MATARATLLNHSLRSWPPAQFHGIDSRQDVAVLSAQYHADDRGDETHRQDQNHRERRVDVR
jgi:hypothetical protein